MDQSRYTSWGGWLRHCQLLDQTSSQSSKSKRAIFPVCAVAHCGVRGHVASYRRLPALSGATVIFAENHRHGRLDGRKPVCWLRHGRVVREYTNEIASETSLSL